MTAWETGETWEDRGTVLSSPSASDKAPENVRETAKRPGNFSVREAPENVCETAKRPGNFSVREAPENVRGTEGRSFVLQRQLNQKGPSLRSTPVPVFLHVFPPFSPVVIFSLPREKSAVSGAKPYVLPSFRVQ